MNTKKMAKTNKVEKWFYAKYGTVKTIVSKPFYVVNGKFKEIDEEAKTQTGQIINTGDSINKVKQTFNFKNPHL